MQRDCRHNRRPSTAFYMLIYWQGYILFLFIALYPADTDAISPSQCLADVINCANSASNCSLNISNATAFSILRTSQGLSVTSTDAATGLSYTGCATYCGTGQDQFSWTSFAQDYAAWLLPYLALVSQLPFGAQRRMDNLMSALLTLGSPTLAGYSLYMTLLNARWVNDQLFAGIDYPSAAVRQSVVRVLSSLQQVPLRIQPGEYGGFESLVVHPDNDSWWTTLAEELDYSYQWSIASATSITWVVIAYLLNAVDSIYSVPDNLESNGQGTGSGWLWLLPIVVGWLVLSPKSDHKRVHDAFRRANNQVFVADIDNPIAAPTHIASNFGLIITHGPDWLCGGGITSPDEIRIPPVFNYARAFSWYRNVYLTSLFYRAAWRKSSERVGVDGRTIPGHVRTDVPRASRLGTRDQIIRYCRPDDREYVGMDALWPRGLFFNMAVASLMALQLQWGTTGAAFLVVWFTPTVGLGCRSLAYLIYGALSTAVWMLLVSSSALGYFAHHLLYDPHVLNSERDSQRTPLGVPSNHTLTASPTGDGPHVSVGESSSAIPMLEIRSPNSDGQQGNVQPDVNSYSNTGFTTIERRLQARQICGQMASHIADWLRWIGKSLAIVNAIGIIANSIFQYTGVYTNCYCDSSVFTWGSSAFDVISPSLSDINLARKAWIGALALALSCCSFFVGSIYLVRDALPW